MSTDYLTPHFHRSELACRHCGECEMDAEFMTRLEALRLAYGYPMVVSSGYRCAQHNQDVSSTGAYGPHTTGKAVDIRVSRYAYILLRLAIGHGFGGVGIKLHGPARERYIHLDTLTSSWGPRPALWTYE